MRVATWILVALIAVAGVVALRGGEATELADPRKCVVVTDPDGNPINTVCVPWPFG